MEFADSWLPSANPKISKRFKHQHNKIDERKHLQLAKNGDDIENRHFDK